MTPHKQLFRHNPEEGTWGDCYRTAFACLLDLRPEDVPHVYDKGALDDVATPAIKAWLAGRGMTLIRVAFDGGDLDHILKWMGTCNPGIYYILSGKSQTGCGHVVIACGDKIVHDPSQTDAGIVGACPEDGLYWIEFLGSARGAAVAA